MPLPLSRICVANVQSSKTLDLLHHCVSLRSWTTFLSWKISRRNLCSRFSSFTSTTTWTWFAPSSKRRCRRTAPVSLLSLFLRLRSLCLSRISPRRRRRCQRIWSAYWESKVRRRLNLFGCHLCRTAFTHQSALSEFLTNFFSEKNQYFLIPTLWLVNIFLRQRPTDHLSN